MIAADAITVMSAALMPSAEANAVGWIAESRLPAMLDAADDDAEPSEVTVTDATTVAGAL